MANEDGYIFPPDYDDTCHVLICLERDFVPFVAGAIRSLERRASWATDEDYAAGLQAALRSGIEMSGRCIDELIEANNRVYRLLDAAYNGTEYSYSGAGTPESPYIVSPEIPPAPPEYDAAPEPSLLYFQRELFRSVDNGLHGIDHVGYADLRNIRDQLDAMIENGGDQETLSAEQIVQLAEIVAALA